MAHHGRDLLVRRHHHDCFVSQANRRTNGRRKRSRVRRLTDPDNADMAVVIERLLNNYRQYGYPLMLLLCPRGGGQCLSAFLNRDLFCFCVLAIDWDTHFQHTVFVIGLHVFVCGTRWKCNRANE